MSDAQHPRARAAKGLPLTATGTAGGAGGRSWRRGRRTHKEGTVARMAEGDGTAMAQSVWHRTAPP